MFLPMVFHYLGLSFSFSVACLLDWTPHLVRALWNFSCLSHLPGMVSSHSTLSTVPCMSVGCTKGRKDRWKEGRKVNAGKKTLNFLHLVH